MKWKTKESILQVLSFLFVLVFGTWVVWGLIELLSSL